MIQCAINFDENPWKIFYSGSIIKGAVEISVDKPTDIQSIVLIISGYGFVEWFDFKSNLSYSAKNNYINSTNFLHGSQNGNAVTINTGTHVYKFTCSLPSELPSSVEGVYGRIRYSAKVVFNRPLKFNKIFTTGITVIKVTDLNNENPQIKLPSTLETQEKFWCFCCTSQPFIIEATIPKSGYVCGECIPIKFNINNMTVPPVPPTFNEEICQIIQVNYEVHVKAILNGPNVIPIVKIPIIIGNVPLK
ncbi:arrestin domain-containing protein 17-like [Condylostylus longicornis]|uniref:arrestin domain-containing protein 17-like n=1 Tax=Condylostylus longicornis TaxID=2530218 RepID=UPI00244E49EE|nr:arrestin domain-containing protein 17-like [Condylostylus longicornis]